MKSLRFIASILCAAALLSSCNPMVNTTTQKYLEPLPEGSQIEVKYLQQELPPGLELIGHVSVEETGFTTNCSYDYVVMRAVDEASRAGADLIHIIEHKTPNFFSTCHQIRAMMYKKPRPVPEGDNYWDSDPAVVREEKSSEQPPVDESAQNRVEEATPSSQSEPAAAQPPAANPPAGQEVQPPPNPYMKDVYTTGEEGYNAVKSPPVRLSVGGAYGRRLSPMADGIPNELRDYLNGLRNGYVISADIGFRVGDGFYLGPRFDRFKSSNSIMVTVDNGVSPTASGEMRETVEITFFGLQVAQVMAVGNGGSSFTLTYAIGYMGLNNSGIAPFEIDPNTFIFEPFSFRGANLGLRFAGSYDLALSESTKLSFGLGFSTATIRKLDVDIGGVTGTIELEPEDSEGLLRMDLGAGFTWVF